MTRMNMKEDMLTLPKGTIPSKQIMTKSQNRLKAKRLRENYSRASSGHWKSGGALVEESDEELWSSLVQEVVIKSKDDILFILKNGFKIKTR